MYIFLCLTASIGAKGERGGFEEEERERGKGREGEILKNGRK